MGAIVSAFIAGLFSYLALVIAKEHKISELRQAWIDSLRDELADFFSAVNLINYQADILKEKSQRGKEIDLQEEKLGEAYLLCLQSINRVLMRLNPCGKGNESSASLIEELKVVQKFVNSQNFKTAVDHVPKVRDAAQRLLLKEWKRVKNGEPVFYWTKRFFLSTIIAALLGAIAAPFIFKEKQNEANKVVEPTPTAVMDATAQPPRQP